MKIQQILNTSRPTISFEFFPPKNELAMQTLLTTIEQLREVQPSFTSCTYGAGGSTRARTLDVTRKIQEEFSLEAMAHFTCVGQTVDNIDSVLEDFSRNGIENVLALRGDCPVGQPEPSNGWFPTFKYAVDLIHHIRARFGDLFSIGCAGYPEKHPEALDFESDLMRLKQKVDAGADFVITQLFFINKNFFHFLERARAIGITVPIIAGIMPVTNVAQIKKFTAMCGAIIPKNMVQDLDDIADNAEAVFHYGVKWSTQQCKELLDSNVDGLHFYTLNRSNATRIVVENLRSEGLL